MLKSIPQHRILLYILLIGLLPILFAGFYFISNLNQVIDIENALQIVNERAFIREKKQATNMAVRNFYSDADHFYIDKHLETLTFLEPEIESLQKIVSTKNYVEDEAIKKRLEYLTGPSNNLVFSEGVVQSYPLFQETTETLVHPVEVNTEDLRQILSLIDGNEIGKYKPASNRPQLIILDFKIDRRAVNDKNEVYTLNLKLLKREFL